MKAAQALHTMGKFGARVFERALRDPNPRVVSLGLTGLTHHPELAAEIPETLTRITESSDPLQRRRAIWLVGEMGTTDPDAAQRLREIRIAGGRLDRANATIALAKLEPDEIYFQPLLDLSLWKSMPHIRTGALEALRVLREKRTAAWIGRHSTESGGAR